MPQGQWSYTFVLENYNRVSGFRMGVTDILKK